MIKSHNYDFLLRHKYSEKLLDCNICFVENIKGLVIEVSDIKCFLGLVNHLMMEFGRD